jgi:putative thioredoxin
MEPILSGEPKGGTPDVIKDSDTQNFTADVMEASSAAPVIVDFWAPWCGPCKQLTPLLEKTVTEAGGAVRMVKINIDENQALASQLGVQSIPAVFAFIDGRPVDGFMGALPESQIKEFVTRLTSKGGGQAEPQEIDVAKQALAAGDVNQAAQIFGALLQQDAANETAVAGLAECYIGTGDLERAEQTLELLPSSGASAPEVATVRAKLDLAKKAGDAGDLEPLQKAVAENSDDFQARFDLAIALNAQGEREAALEQLLAIMARTSDWNDGAAHQQLLQFFEAWGTQDPASVKGRQKLSSLLFA